MKNIITLEILRKNIQEYARKVQGSLSFIIFKRSKPLFKIFPIEEELWEKIIDFTKIKKEGTNIKELLQRL